MSKSNRFRSHGAFQLLTTGTVRAAMPGLGQYKVYCPRCDQAAIVPETVLRCLYCGQAYCPPSFPRTFR